MENQTPNDGAPEKDLAPVPQGLAGVAEILRRNQGTLDNREGIEDPLQAITDREGGGADKDDDTPAAAADQHQEPAPDDVAEPPALSEDGLGMQPAKEPDGGDTGDPANELTLQSLAEKAGITVEDLYAVQLKLGGEGDEVTTLGQLKDGHRDYSRLTEERTEFEETKMGFENDVMRSRGELQEVIALLPELPPALIEHAQATFAAERQKEHAALLTIKPEWADEQKYSRALDGIMESAAVYGFKRSDLNSITDHRLLKLLDDFHTMRQRFSAANAAGKRVVKQSKQRRAKANAGPRSEERTQKIVEQGRAASSTFKKVEAVNALLAGNSRNG